jgi:peptidoglycan/xylan/chitin deacetylase (PgdA/CDA1 family)
VRRVKLTLLFACKLLGAFALARRLTRRHLKILCYHGFALDDEVGFRPKLFIEPRAFEERMSWLEGLRFQVLPLGQAVEGLYNGSLPDNAVAITIDDGFHSVARAAAPVLARHRFPATVYVTSYYVKHSVPIFRLTIQYMLWKTARKRVRLHGRPWTSDQEFDLSSPAQRDALAQQLIEHGEVLGSEQDRQRLCREFGQLLDVPFETINQARLLNLMTPAELGSLAAQGIDVQLHTHRHRLPVDDEFGVRREIEDNRCTLAPWVPGPLEHFCYPSGLWHPRQAQWLDTLGIKSSTTCLPGLNSSRTPRHALRRFLDGSNIHALEFEAAVSGFLDLVKGRR